MPSSLPPLQLHFFCEEPFKGFARIEGIATIEETGVTFEYAMTGSVGTTPKGSVRKHLSFDDIASIELRKHWLSATRFRFRSKSLKAIESYPTSDPSVFEIEVAQESRADKPAFAQALRAAFERHLASRSASGMS